jgi:hypothetical protein
MLNRKNSALVPLLGLMTLAACGKAERAAETVSLQGQWGADCSAEPASDRMASLGQVGSSARSLKVSAEKVELEERVYGGTTCEKPLAAVTRKGHLEVKEKIAEEPETHALRITVDQSLMTPSEPDVAKAFNTVSLCGYTTWAAGQPLDITGRECAFRSIATAGTTYFTTFRKEGDTLQLADFDCSKQGGECQTFTSNEAVKDAHPQPSIVYKRAP